MHSIREYQGRQLLEQRDSFMKRQEVAQAKIMAMEKRKLAEVKRRKKIEAEKEIGRHQVFVQMKQRAEERRQSFLEDQVLKERQIELTRSKLERERALTKEKLKLIAAEKQDQVQRAKRKEAYQRDKARAELARKEKTFVQIKQQKSALVRERKAMQRQSHIERVQMLDSLEKLKTFGGKPDATLMSMLGDSWGENLDGSGTERQQANSHSVVMLGNDDHGAAAPVEMQRSQQSTDGSNILPAIASATEEAAEEFTHPPGSPPAEPPPSPRDIHIIRLEDLRRYQNEELLAALHQEHEKEKERELIIGVIDDGTERTRIDRLFGAERAKARRAIKRLTKQHERELKHMAARFEAESVGYMEPEFEPGPDSSNSAQIRISSRQSIEATAIQKVEK
eukprot:SAG31_NODE_2983_length_4824_cov_319.300741_2_plen_394_part_00